MKNKFFIATYGCQMNDYDTKVIESLLLSEGFERTETPEEADTLIVNGCSVREHAEERALGFINSVRRAGRNSKRIVLAGCLARSLKNLPSSVDMAVSATEYLSLPRLLSEGESDTALSSHGDYTGVTVDSGITLLTPISKGCDNFCSYCIVPFLRGREESFSPESIISQIGRSITAKTREILLMGQNVNSYRHGSHDFVRLLSVVLKEFPEMRVRFITSHPKDFSLKLIEMMADNRMLCSHLHLPLQSGSDRMLFLMHRQYNYAYFRSLITEARRIMPSLTVTTDIMVGLPYETESDFNSTINAVGELRFDDAFMYKYSERRFALSRYMPFPPADEGLTRLKILISVQQRIKRERLAESLGKRLCVLAERESKKNPNEWFGRDSGNRSVIIRGSKITGGDTYEVAAESISGITLTGKIAEEK